MKSLFLFFCFLILLGGCNSDPSSSSEEEKPIDKEALLKQKQKLLVAYSEHYTPTRILELDDLNQYFDEGISIEEELDSIYRLLNDQNLRADLDSIYQVILIKYPELESSFVKPSPKPVERDTAISAEYRHWLYYEKPASYSSLRLSLDTIRHLFKHKNLKVLDLPDYDEPQKYYAAGPHINDAIFQEERMNIYVTEDLIMGECHLYSIQDLPHCADSLWAITVTKGVRMYATKLHFLIYDKTGKRITEFIAAEDNGDGGYGHHFNGKFINDSVYYHTGKGYDTELEYEDGDGDNNSGEFVMDTVWYTIDRYGVVTRRK
jgi:hypothetical protein